MRHVVAGLGLSVVFASCGCSTGTLPSNAGANVLPSIHGAQGIVHGGQQPISNSTIQLYAVGTTGYGSAATPLLSTAVTTSDGSSMVNFNANSGNANNTLPVGSFTISGDYTCPANDPEVYITATAGNPGLTAGTNNTAITLVAALTDCNTLKANAASTYIVINEVTTVAAAYALGQFTSANGIGAYGYANQGLLNAFATANNIVNTATGMPRTMTPSGNGVVPQAEINSLADILAPCVNSSSSVSAACASLFSATSIAGNTATSTWPAAIYIAGSPGNNILAPNRVSTVFALAFANAPFQPSLVSAPNDLTIAVSYNNNQYTNPTGVAIDGFGNVWTANYNGGGSTSALGKMSPTGAVQAVNQSVLTGIDALAIDTQNGVWIAGRDNGAVVGYQNSGNSFAGPLNGYKTPKGIAIDGLNNLWVTSSGDSTVWKTPLFYGNGNGIFGASSVFSGGGLTAPTGIAFDAQGDAWIANAASVTELSNAGVALAGSPFTGGGISSPAGIAVDGSNNIWIANSGQADVAELNDSGTPVTGSNGYTSGVGSSYTVAIDGAGNVWTANANSLSEITSSGIALSGTTGYQGGNLSAPTALAVDGSGNVWVTHAASAGTTLAEFVGAAVPAVTPISVALETGQVGQKPGTPIPVVITSSALPYYTPTLTQSVQLHAAGGNSGSYIWSSTSTFPTGYTLSSTGLISGSSSVSGTTAVQIQACDTANLTNCATKSFTLSSISALPSLGGEGALNGTYAIRYSGFRNGANTGAVFGTMFVASVTFNGNGVISGGEVDTMNAGSTSISTLTGLTGVYAVGSDHLGTMVVQSGTTTIQFSISVGNFNGAVGQTIHLIGFGDTQATSGGAGGDIGAGIGKLQTAASFAGTTLNASFAFGFEGETPCTNYLSTNPACPQTIAPFGPLSAAGYFTGNGAGTITGGEEDATAVGTNYPAVLLSGNYTNPDSSGRGTITLVPTGSLYPLAPTHFVYYIVNTGEMFILSTDGHFTNSMLSGDALLRTPSLFTSPNPLTGTFIGYSSSPDNGDGVSFYPSQSDADIYMLTASGTQFNVMSDQNDAGSISLNSADGVFSYSIDTNGRLTGSGGLPTFYMANLTQGFGTYVAQSTQYNPGLVVLQQQSGGPFTVSSVNGTYGYGDIAPPMQTSMNVGVFVSGGSGSGTATDNESFNTGVLALAQTNSSSVTVANNGRGVLNNSTGSSILYLISPGSAVGISTSASSTAPAVSTIQK